MKKSLTISLILASLCAFAIPTRQALVTASGYTGASTLANFPVLVRISPSAISGFTYTDCAAGGADISFALADETPLPHEIDTWDTSGESLVWVKVPALAGTTTSFYLRWNDSTPPANTPSDVWADADYAGVWHMNGASGTIPDSTANGLDATPMSNTVNSIGVSGVIGTARQTATSAERGYLSIPSYDSLGLAGTFRFSCWLYQDGTVKEHRLFSRKASYNAANGWEVESSSYTGVRARGSDGNTRVDATIPSLNKTWQHLAFVYNDTSLMIYTNGALCKSGTVKAPKDNGLPLSLGCNSPGTGGWVRGRYDEVRLQDGIPSADWLRAEYDTMTDVNFLTIGPAETMSNDGLLIVAGDPSRLGNPTPPYGSVQNLTPGAVVALSMAGTAVPGEGTITNYLSGWNLGAIDSGTGVITPIRSSESLLAGESVTNCIYTHSAAAQFTWLWEARDALGLGDLAVVTNGGDHIVFSTDVTGIGYTAPSATLKFVYGFLPDELVWTNAVNSSISSFGTVQATLPRLTPGAFYYIKAILETNDQVKDYAETGVVAIRAASYNGDPSSWQDETAPILTGVTLNGTGGDTLVVSGNLASFTGDSCALRVLVGLSPETMTNVWSGLGGSTLDATGAFSLTLHEADCESVRYLAPHSTYYAAVVATSSNGKVSVAPVLSVTMSPKGYWTYVEEGVDHNKIGYGYVTDGVWKLYAKRTQKNATTLSLTGSGGKFYGAAPSPMNFTNVRDEGGVAYQVVAFGTVMGRNAGQLLYNQASMLTELVAPDCVQFNTGSSYIFGSCTAMTNVVLNADFSALVDGCFNNCTALRTIHPRRLMCATVPYYGFRLCSSLEGTLELPVCTTIGGYSFSSCTSLHKVVATNATVISDYAFSGCTGLYEVIASPALTQVSVSGFSGCTALRPDFLGTILGKTLRYFGKTDFSKMGEEFSGCTSLKGPLVWDFPNLVTNVVNKNGFLDCSSLESVVFKTPVAEIRDNAFYGLKAGAELHMHAQAPAVFGARVAGSQTAPYPRIYLKDNFNAWLSAMNVQQDLMRSEDFDNHEWSSKVRADTITWATMAAEMAKDTSLCTAEMSGKTITKVNVDKKVLGIMLYCHNHAHWMCWVLREPKPGTVLLLQ